MLNLFKKKRQTEWTQLFNELDEETQQETAVKYLRRLDATSLKRLIEAVDKYREGDKVLERVKDPEPEDEGDNLEKSFNK